MKCPGFDSAVTDVYICWHLEMLSQDYSCAWETVPLQSWICPGLSEWESVMLCWKFSYFWHMITLLI